LIIPVPWALHALHFLANHPEIPFGVHLTVIGDGVDYRWGPVSPSEKVSSLIDNSGYFYNFKHMSEFLAQARLDQLEMEFRAQIEVVLASGLKPTHLDWHSLRIGGRADIFEIMLGLANEYGLALRVTGRSLIENLQRQGFPTNVYDFLDSYSLEPVNKSARYAQMLHNLPTGLTESAVHPGLDNSELMAIEPNNYHARQTDFDVSRSERYRKRRRYRSFRLSILTGRLARKVICSKALGHPAIEPQQKNQPLRPIFLTTTH
jgi:predicted glycoside hydrolase/deacetylase ChbG (UPF0249 family)